MFESTKLGLQMPNTILLGQDYTLKTNYIVIFVLWTENVNYTWKTISTLILKKYINYAIKQ